MRFVRPCLGDAALEIAGEGLMLDRHAAGHHRRPVGEFRQQRDHGVDEQVGALLVADAAEAADGVRARAGRRPKTRPRRSCARMEFLEVDAVHDHGMRNVEEARRALIGGDHRIHAPDQPFGERLVIALRGRGEDQLERRPQHVAQQRRRRSSRCCAGHARCGTAARAAAAAGRRPAASRSPAVRPEARARASRSASVRACIGIELDDRAGDAGQPALEVRRNDLDVSDVDCRARLALSRPAAHAPASGSAEATSTIS